MKKRVVTLIVFLLMFVCFRAVGDDHSPATPSDNRLLFEIEPTKDTYQMGEAVEFRFRLQNLSKQRILVARTFQLTHFVHLDISTPQGGSAEWCGRIISQIDSPRSFVILSPHESTSTKLTVSCVNKENRGRAWGYLFEKPGTYTVNATYRLPHPTSFTTKQFPNASVIYGPVSAKPFTFQLK
jgi:hypothetical protein